MISAFKSLIILSVAAGALAGSSTTVKLVASVTSSDLTPSIQGQELFIDTAHSRVKLGAPGSGWSFYEQGVKPETDVESQTPRERLGLVVQPGGTATVPTTNVVKVSQGTGSAGVSITNGKLDFKVANKGGKFTACPASVLDQDGSDVLISFINDGQRPLLGCATIDLLATCTDTGNTFNPNTVQCA